jgi:hypothetical protein
MKAADITTDHGVVNNTGKISAGNISITTYSILLTKVPCTVPETC